MGGHTILSLYTSSKASRIRNLTANLPISIRRYTQGKKESHSGHGGEERAPSTAEEFERVAEEKSRRQGCTSQTVEKAADGAVEATLGESPTFESVKEAEKEPPGKGDFQKTGNK